MFIPEKYGPPLSTLSLLGSEYMYKKLDRECKTKVISNKVTVASDGVLRTFVSSTNLF